MVSKTMANVTPKGPSPDRPATELGACLRRARISRRLTQVALFERTGVQNSQISRIEHGGNVEVGVYETLARALGFRHALELFQSGGDEKLRRLLLLWKGLPDEAAQSAALAAVKAIRDAAEES